MTHHRKISLWLSVAALAAIVLLVVLISHDTIYAKPSAFSPHNLRVQLGIYLVLLADMIVVFAISARANRITSLLKSYIALLIIVLYFSSLIFFAEERGINADVNTYGDALWWAVMCMTTAGSYITEYTVIGKIMSVILSGGGLILFPVFTVYITNAVLHKENQG